MWPPPHEIKRKFELVMHLLSQIVQSAVQAELGKIKSKFSAGNRHKYSVPHSIPAIKPGNEVLVKVILLRSL